MGVSVRVRWGVWLVVEVGDGFAGSHDACAAEEAAGAVEVGDSDGFAVPAGALAINAATGFFGVLFAGPLKAVSESHFFDLVVVVYKDFSVTQFKGLGCTEVEIAPGEKLVRVPDQVNVQCRDCHALGVFRHNAKENMVLVD